MGECGCGETIPYKIFDVGGNVMVVEIYRGCDLCETGLMVVLHMNSPENAAEWGWEPEAKFEPDKFGHALLDFPLLGKDDLIEAAKQMRADECFGGDGYDSLTDWLEDNGLEFLQRAVELRLADCNGK